MHGSGDWYTDRGIGTRISRITRRRARISFWGEERGKRSKHAPPPAPPHFLSGTIVVESDRIENGAPLRRGISAALRLRSGGATRRGVRRMAPPQPSLRGAAQRAQSPLRTAGRHLRFATTSLRGAAQRGTKKSKKGDSRTDYNTTRNNVDSLHTFRGRGVVYGKGWLYMGV